MRLVSFEHSGRPSWGAMTGEGIVDLRSALGERYADLRSVLRAGALAAVESAVSAARPSFDADEITFLPVLPNPEKILCIGLNYEMHRRETGRNVTEYPTVFTRFADTQVGHGGSLVRPLASNEFDYEGELAVIVGKRGRHIPKAAAMSHVAGYSCYNDASVRDFQRHSSQFTAGKNFPATGGFGPCLVTPDEVGDAHALPIRTILNGEVMQSANTSQLIFDIPTLIAYLSTFTELRPGDVIATGTPGGVGFKRDPQVFMNPGDEIAVEISKVGTLVNRVVSESL
ncbi:MAG: fumarylacetoacetate hydrolase family protein [Woeseiaceae bacterium]